MQRQVSVLSTIFRPKSYMGLLGSVMAISFASSLISDLILANVVTTLLASLTLFMAGRAANMDRKQLRLNVCIALLGVAFVAVLLIDRTLPPRVVDVFQSLSIICGMCFVFNTMAAMLRDIFSYPVTTNKICGAICVYLLIGVTFEFLYMLIELHDPNAFQYSFREQVHNHGIQYSNRSLFMYYSFCTLTTLGYGDIVPINRIVRMLAWIEAVSGQFYLSILVARLVGLYISSEMIKELPIEERRIEAEAEKDLNELGAAKSMD